MLANTFHQQINEPGDGPVDVLLRQPSLLCHHRVSALSGRPRYATHPVNAMLNYAYSVVAAQLTRSLAAYGFDPACGFLHADAPGRYSLAYDLMELLRADIDGRMFAWITSHTWKRPDFPVTPEGVVRLQPTLAAVVAQKAALPQQDIDRTMSWLAELLLKGAGQAGALKQRHRRPAARS